MADDKKITQLPLLVDPAEANDVLVIVNSGTTKQITVSDIFATPQPIGSDAPSTGEFTSLELPTGSTIDEFSTDGFLSDDSDSAVPTEKAVKTYVDAAVLAGTSGTSGTSGLAGTSGSSGTSGLAGTSGTSGVSGTSGSSGTSGLAGTSGSSGIAGTSGSSGTSGLAGTSGSSGTSGVAGVAGTSGSSGTSGIAGAAGTSGSSGSSGTSGVGGDAINIRFVSSDSTAIAGDAMLVDTTGGDVDIYIIPSSNGKVIVKKISDDLNKVFLVPLVGTIDGKSQLSLDIPYEVYEVLSDGNDLFVI